MTFLPAVFGAMTLGQPRMEGARVRPRRSHKEIDTARLYDAGSSEAILAQTEWEKRGLVSRWRVVSSPPGIGGI